MSHLAFLFQKYPGQCFIVTPTTPIGRLAHHLGRSSIRLQQGWQQEHLQHDVRVGREHKRLPGGDMPGGYVDPVQGKGKILSGSWPRESGGLRNSCWASRERRRSISNGVYPGGRVRPKEWLDVVKLASD